MEESNKFEGKKINREETKGKNKIVKIIKGTAAFITSAVLILPALINRKK